MHQYQKIPSKHTCTNDSMSVQRQLINDSLIFWLFYLFFLCAFVDPIIPFLFVCVNVSQIYIFFSMVLHSTVCCFSNNNGLECLRNFNKKKKKRRLWFIYLNICPFFRFVHSCILFDLSCWFFHVTKFFFWRN